MAYTDHRSEEDFISLVSRWCICSDYQVWLRERDTRVGMPFQQCFFFRPGDILHFQSAHILLKKSIDLRCHCSSTSRSSPETAVGSVEPSMDVVHKIMLFGTLLIVPLLNPHTSQEWVGRKTRFACLFVTFKFNGSGPFFLLLKKLSSWIAISMIVYTGV